MTLAPGPSQTSPTNLPALPGHQHFVHHLSAFSSSLRLLGTKDIGYKVTIRSLGSHPLFYGEKSEKKRELATTPTPSSPPASSVATLAPPATLLAPAASTT